MYFLQGRHVAGDWNFSTEICTCALKLHLMLIPQCRVLEKLMLTKWTKKFPDFYKSRCVHKSTPKDLTLSHMNPVHILTTASLRWSSAGSMPPLSCLTSCTPRKCDIFRWITFTVRKHYYHARKSMKYISF